MKTGNKRMESVMILILSIIALTLFFFGVNIMAKLAHSDSALKYFLYFISYSILLFVFEYLKTKFPKIKIFKWIFKIVSLPCHVLLPHLDLIMHLSFPFVAIIGYILTFCLFVGIAPLLLVAINNAFSIISVSAETFTYIKLTMFAIIATTFFKTFVKITDKISMFGHSEKMKRYNIKELVHYIFTFENIRFVIYVMYFIFMIIYSIQYLENSISFKWNAFSQSFLTYLAFDSIIVYIQKLSFSPVEFLKKVIYSIDPDDDEKRIDRENNDSKK